MTKRKKAAIICIGIFGIILIGLVSAYFIYGSTLLNGYSEETIIKELSEDTDNPIEILAMQKYEDHLGILYKDPMAEDPLNGTNAEDYAFFAHYIKHRLYKNRYYYKGGSPGGNVTCPLTSALVEDVLQVPCFVYDIGRGESRCVVYEADAMGNTVRKLDEFEVPANEPYIILKEYELLNIFHHLEACGASQDTPREYNENYLETDKEWFNMLRNDTEAEPDKELDALYEKAFG